jgi:hypothetical protein
MKFGLLVLMCAISACSAWSQTHCTPGSTETAKQELLQEENHWLQVEDDANALESILAPDFLHVVRAGIITRDEQLEYMRTHPAPRSNAVRHFEGLHVRLYGSVGIVNGAVVLEDGRKR